MAREEKSEKYIAEAKGNEYFKKEYEDEISFQQVTYFLDIGEIYNSHFITEEEYKRFSPATPTSEIHLIAVLAKAIQDSEFFKMGRGGIECQELRIRTQG